MGVSLALVIGSGMLLSALERGADPPSTHSDGGTAFAAAALDPDLNNDGVVSATDLSIVGRCTGQSLIVMPECRCADTDGDGDVDSIDVNFVRANMRRTGYPIGIDPCVARTATPTRTSTPVPTNTPRSTATQTQTATDTATATATVTATEVLTFACTPGEQRSCYEGSPETQGVGICRAGVRICLSDGSGFSECVNQILAELVERCDGIDNDCDGDTDEGLVQSCYGGPSSTEGLGICRAGQRTCTDGTFGDCTGQVLPQPEGPFGHPSCSDYADNDCDRDGDLNDPGCKPTCGNGVVELGEKCDDGNLDATDACLPTCELPRCGDAIVWSGAEECDPESAAPVCDCFPPGFATPCTCCPPPVAGVEPIPAGTDTFQSRAFLAIEISEPFVAAGIVERLTCVPEGPPVEVIRGEHDLTTGTILTEMVSLDLSCSSRFVGQMRINESQDRRSAGAINGLTLSCVGGTRAGKTCAAAEDCPCGGTCSGFGCGSSFFDIFVDVQLANIGATLVNYDEPGGRDFPVRMEAQQICDLPPLETVYIAPPQDQPLFLKGTSIQVGRLLHAEHRPSVACGNGVLEVPEECDDGNTLSCDGCSPGNGAAPACANEQELERTLGYIPCEDDLFCTVQESCQGATCGSGVPRDCSFLDDTCGVGTCNEEMKRCDKVPRSTVSPCDDQNPCTANDQCVGVECRGAPVPISTQCDDGDACTSFDGTLGHPDRCDGTGRCVRQSVECDDGVFCNGREQCSAGTCVSSGDPCSLSANLFCDEGLGRCACNNDADCDDGSVCNGSEHCLSGRCVGGNALTCDDGNPCTSDACDPVIGCFAADNGIPCDDGNPCTVNDRCGNGLCFPGTQRTCADGNICTDDECDQLNGCVHRANASPCDDDNPCTVSDACAGSLCTPGSALPCDDGNLCTDDACVAASGCVHTLSTCGDGTVQAGCEACDPALGDSCGPSQFCVGPGNADSCTCQPLRSLRLTFAGLSGACTAYNSIGAGLQRPSSDSACLPHVVLDAPAPAAGVIVRIESLDPSQILVSTSLTDAGAAAVALPVAAGETETAQFYIHAAPGAPLNVGTALRASLVL